MNDRVSPEFRHEQKPFSHVRELLSLVDVEAGTTESEQKNARSFLRELPNEDLLDLDDALVTEKGREASLALMMVSNEILHRKREGLLHEVSDNALPAPRMRHEDSDSKLDVYGRVVPGELDEFDQPGDETA